jgi:hypothetical protein
VSTHHTINLILRQKRIVKITVSAMIAPSFQTKRIIDLLPYAVGRGCSTVTDIEFGKFAALEEIQFESAGEFRVGKSVDRSGWTLTYGVALSWGKEHRASWRRAH